MARVIALASGKGGVGKSLITSNLAVWLSLLGKRVILVDLDLGGSNLHSFVGMENKHVGIGRYYHDKSLTLGALPVDTSFPGLSIITGDSLLPGTANIPFFFKQKLLRDLPRLEADFILLDLGAGSAYNTVDYFIAGAEGLLVTTPEPTSLLNAYAYLKTCYFRKLYRRFGAKSEERKVIVQWFSKRLEGSGRRLEDLLVQLGEMNEESGPTAREALEEFTLDLVVNDVYHPDEESFPQRLIALSRKYLGHEFRRYGSLSHDPKARASLFAKTPAVIMDSESPFSRGIAQLAEKLTPPESETLLSPVNQERLLLP